VPSAPTVLSLHAGQPESLGVAGAAVWFDEAWQTAIFKRRLTGPVAVTELGLTGDGHADLANHGGLDKAVCVYPAEHYAGWRDALSGQLGGSQASREFADGAFGENVTISALTERDVCIGDTYNLGSLIVQVSQPRQPCWKLARKWRIKDLTAQAIANGHTGWYFRVLREGSLNVGDTLGLRERRHPEWTVAAANLVMHHRVGDTRALIAVAALSESWKRTLRSRGSEADS
jgi:MOSC domain-containing protein YiiM